MPKTIYRGEYGAFLRLLRECRASAGLTQTQCSAAMARPQSFVSDVERGRRRLDVVQLRDLCHILGVGLVDFVERFEAELARKTSTVARSAKPAKPK